MAMNTFSRKKPEDLKETYMYTVMERHPLFRVSVLGLTLEVIGTDVFTVPRQQPMKERPDDGAFQPLCHYWEENILSDLLLCLLQ